MLDGSHRTTALTLACRSIAVVMYETDMDIREARGLVATGQILENGTLDLTVEEGIGRLVMIGPSGGGKSTLLLSCSYFGDPDNLVKLQIAVFHFRIVLFDNLNRHAIFLLSAC